MADLQIRNLDEGVAARFRQGAGARGLTLSDYLTALVELHANMQAIAERHGDEAVREEVMGWLVTLNLQTVTR